MDDVLKVRQMIDGKTEYEALWAVGQAKDSGILGELTWPEIAQEFNNAYREDETCFFDASAYRKKYRNYLDAYEQLFSKEQFTTDQASEYVDQKRELQKLKTQIQTEKLEYNRWLREEARDELIAEHICAAIRDLPALDIPRPIQPEYADRAGILLLADAHYGVDLKISGLFGETINEYSPEIFESRMWDLLNQVVYICNKEGFSSLNVYDLGDEVDGLLRISQLWKLRYGVIESTVRYGRFITEWLNELTHHVRVKYQMVSDSNHCQLRLLSQPKNTFKDENMSYVIQDKIIDRLGDNPNFEFVKNPTGYIYDSNVVGYSVLGFHGECKNLEQTIKNFSRTYGTHIDFLVAGHKHHQMSSNVGIESDIIGAPSLIGVDDYALSLHKTSDPGATLFVLEENKGKVIEYNIKL